MFGLFKRRKPHVYEQWIAPILDFSSDAPRFYAAVEEELRQWEVPGLVTTRITFKDGGWLSMNREYLRVQRESLVFDIGSAKFGKNWWFSCRSAVLPRVLYWWELLVFLCGFAALAACYWQVFGISTGSIAMGSTLALLLVMLVAGRSWSGMDDFLLSLPVIGALYELLFRAESYYRDDARRMYVSIVDHLVREKVKEFAAAGGVDEVQFNEVKDIHQITGLIERVVGFMGAAAQHILPASKHS